MQKKLFSLDPEALHRDALAKMRFDNLSDILNGHVAIPNVIGIDDDGCALLASIEAA